jgi:hypothetical protein
MPVTLFIFKLQGAKQGCIKTNTKGQTMIGKKSFGNTGVQFLVTGFQVRRNFCAIQTC